jgi:hypothetical protein
MHENKQCPTLAFAITEGSKPSKPPTNGWDLVVIIVVPLIIEWGKALDNHDQCPHLVLRLVGYCLLLGICPFSNVSITMIETL